MISRFRMTLAMVVTAEVLCCSYGNADEGTILARWKLRKALLSQFRVEYSSVSTPYPSPDRLKRVEFRTSKGDLLKMKEIDKPTIREGMYVFDSQRIRHTFQTPESVSAEDSGSHIQWMTSVSTEKKFESLTGTFGKVTPIWQTGPAKAPPKDLYLDVALGLRLWGSRNRLSDEEIRTAQVEEKGEGQLKVNFSGEYGVLHSAGISLRNGFDILSWNLFDAQGKKRLEIIPSGYTDDGSLSLPHLIEVTLFRPDGSLVERTEMKIRQFEVGLDGVQGETFEIERPSDVDMITGRPFQ